MSGAAHTGGLAYPREWFEVTQYSKSPRPLQFQSETEKTLSTGTRRYHKVTDYARWYPTRGEAEAAIAEIAAKNAAVQADRRLRDAAPELLEALEMVIADFADYPASERPCLAFDRARAAIAKTKEAPNG